ncbi:MAG: hypothetical protein Q7S98_05960 [Deltaproteobacteria bacterium]|nr:hypothetical protein [Deltaproteobacteria bacterium]
MMKTKMKKRLIGILPFLLFPLTVQAVCLTNCETTVATTNNNDGASIGVQSSDRRERSHNFGNNNTAILGDVNIRVGHENLTINGGFGEGKNNVIDASITSFINLGDFAK